MSDILKEWEDCALRRQSQISDWMDNGLIVSNVEIDAPTKILKLIAAYRELDEANRLAIERLREPAGAIVVKRDGGKIFASLGILELAIEKAKKILGAV